MIEYINRLGTDIIAGVIFWFDTGGTVGHIIIVLGVSGCAFGIWRCWVLWRLQRAVAKVAQQAALSDCGSEDSEDKAGSRGTCSDDAIFKLPDPLSRIVATATQYRHADVEALELHLDEAMTRELPLLKRGLRVVKLLAAITPLLGLLGTVVGMMDAMQAMASIAESQRVEAMATGISLALMTTMLGLAFAVPLILLHATAVAASNGIEVRLEKYCAREMSARASKASG